MHDSAKLEYQRVNITVPKSVLQFIKTEYPDESRSKVLTLAAIDELQKRDKRNKMKKWAQEYKNMPKELKEEENEILDDFGNSLLID